MPSATSRMRIRRNKVKIFGQKGLASTLITLAIVAMLIISAGPAQAVSVKITGLQERYTHGGSVDFQVSIDIWGSDRYVPVTNITLNITGFVNKSRVFFLNGTPISGDENITITNANISLNGFEYGNGTGWDDLLNENINFGYGYGYGTGTNLTYVYNVSVDSAQLPLGNYTASASLNAESPTKKHSFSSAPVSFEIAPIQVSMEIKPESINPRSKGRIKVTIFNDTPPGFDVASINISSVRFGPAGASVVKSETPTDKLILHFNTEDTGIQCGDTQANLTGKTNVGLDIRGIDNFRTVCAADQSMEVLIPLNLTTNRTEETTVATSPLGNVTLTIPNGTLAVDINGNPLTNISINSTLPTNARVALSGDDRVVGETVDLGPEGARFDPPIQIRFNYTMPLPRGVREDSLEVRFFNASTNKWEPLSIFEHNKRENYIIANISHFSAFALVGVAAAPPREAPSAAGEGSGGVTTAEPFENIAKAERIERDLVADKPILYTFKTPELGIYEIVVTGKENEPLIAIRVEALKGTSKLVAAPAPGTVYKNVNIWAGSKRVREALVRFKVENSWIEGNSLARTEVQMLRWAEGEWKTLETREIGKDDLYTYFEAKTPSLSMFAISGIKPVPTPTPEVTITPTPTPEVITPTPTPTKKPTPGFEIAASLIAIALVYLLVKKRRQI